MSQEQPQEITIQTPIDVFARLRTPGAVVFVHNAAAWDVMNAVLVGARRAGVIDAPVPVKIDPNVSPDDYIVRIPADLEGDV